MIRCAKNAAVFKLFTKKLMGGVQTPPPPQRGAGYYNKTRSREIAHKPMVICVKLKVTNFTGRQIEWSTPGYSFVASRFFFTVALRKIVPFLTLIPMYLDLIAAQAKCFVEDLL